MKKICLFLILYVSICFSQIVSFSQSFNAVYVKAPAKSKQSICKTRVDLAKGLIDNYACDVNNIHVRDKNNFWVGSLGGISAYSDEKYNDYDDGRYIGNGRKIYVDYVSPTKEATWEDSNLVSCPTNYIKQIESIYFICIKKANCNKNEKYNVETNECISPDSGYIWLNKNKNDFTQRPECKGENERYNKDSGYCEEKIENSHWVGNTLNYECDNGYIELYGRCERKTNCNDNEHYNIEENNCVELPDNAHWVDKTSTKWVCNENYIERYNSCEEKTHCNIKQKYDENTNSCIDAPEHGFWNAQNILECENGYIKVYENCEEKAICNNNQKYSRITNTCIDAPEHGFWNSYGELKCEKGYIEVYGNCEEKANCERWNSIDNTCFEKPENSHWTTSYSSDWECNEGYHYNNTNNTCFKCDDGMQYSYSHEACISKPENAEWISEGRWQCKDGYFQYEYGCEEIKKCGFFEHYNSNNNECVEKPSHSHWSYDNSPYWECDDGYYETYNTCEKINPINLKNYIHFAHDINIGLGISDGKDLKNNDITILTVDTYYNIGFKIGNEFFNIRTQFELGLLYTEFEYSYEEYSYMDESINSLAFTFGPNFGFDLWLFTFDYSYIWNTREELESIEFSQSISKYKFGISFNEHFNINVTLIDKLIKNTKRLKEFDKNMFIIGLTYRF